MKNILFIITAILLVSCSRKQVPQIATPTTYDKCDSAIQQILDSVKAVKTKTIIKTVTVPGFRPTNKLISDTLDCNQYKVQLLELASKLHTANKETEYYKALAQSKPPRKVINNINSGNKNTQIGDANVQQIKPKATAVVGEGNVTTIKPKQSAIGDGNDLDNSKKGSSWFWIFVAGNLSWLIIQNLLYPILMRFIPFANLTSNIGKALLKLKFW
jgi:hypothetical protein